MTQSEIKDIDSRVRHFLRAGRMHDALRLVRNTAQGADLKRLLERVAQHEQTYSYMLRYLTEGAFDPDRDKQYQVLENDVYATLDQLVRTVSLPTQPTMYAGAERTMQLADVNLPEMLKHAKDDADDTTLANLFDAVWTRYPLTNEDADALAQFTADEYCAHIAPAVIAAVVLGLNEYFDPRRLEVLAQIYADGDRTSYTTAIAVTGLLIGLYRHHDRPLPARTVARLQALADDKHWRDDVRTVFLELIRTRDTERISRTMTQEIIPGLMRIRPDVLRKIDEGEIDVNEVDEETGVNPVWEEMLRKEGLYDRIRQLSELQSQGADLFLTTFANLKNFPFFNPVRNWFTPFSLAQREIADKQLPAKLAEGIESVSFICDSDKYSFVLAIDMIPPAQRDMMFAQLSELPEADEPEANDTDADVMRRNVNRWLQNAYRFYHLFRRKGEFYNPFADTGVNLLKVSILDKEFDDAEFLTLIGETYLRMSLYDDALIVFNKIRNELGVNSPNLLQKIGYCQARLKLLDEALATLQQATLGQKEPDMWVLRQIGQLCLNLGKYKLAEQTYRQMLEIEPDDPLTVIDYGRALAGNENYDEAVNQFYKAEYLGQPGLQRIARRALAWTLFAKGDVHKAREVYQKLLSDKTGAHDYLNMGHAALAAAEPKEAINYYKLALHKMDGDIERLIKSIKADLQALDNNGVDRRTVALIIDALLNSLNN